MQLPNFLDTQTYSVSSLVDPVDNNSKMNT